MTNINLSEDQTNFLQELLLQSEGRIRQRVELILLYGQGLQTLQVARKVGLSTSRTRFWKQQFFLHGMDIFNLSGITTQEIHDSQTPAIDVLLPEQTFQPQPSPKKIKKVSSKKGKRETVESLEELMDYPVPQVSPGILREDSLAEAGRKVLLFHFAQMLANEEGTILGNEIEKLHDMRVATRRMRAAYDIFQQAYEPSFVKPLMKGLRATGRALGKVRDMDVFIEKAESYLAILPIDKQTGLDSLLETWQIERANLRTTMVGFLSSSGYLHFKKAFNVFVQTPGMGCKNESVKSLDSYTSSPTSFLVRDIVPILVYTRMGAVRSFEKILPTASITQLHALRIEFKKLRYTLEFFKEVLGSEVASIIDEIKKIQDHLGDLHDAEVACSILNQFLADWDEKQMERPLSERMNPEAIVVYMAYQYAERHRLMVTFTKVWDQFNTPALNNRLSLAIAVL